MSEEQTKLPTMMAFWKYDLFPYMLGGTITTMKENGLVETKEYGYGTLFRPVITIPETSGKKLKADLQALEREYKVRQDQLRNEFISKANDLTSPFGYVK